MEIQDYYEFLQISLNAEPPTIQRVYRFLAGLLLGLEINQGFDRTVLFLFAPDSKGLLILLESKAVGNQPCGVKPLLGHEAQANIHRVQRFPLKILDTKGV